MVFDPVGLICSVTVDMKILFQDVCMSKLKWDQPLTIEFQRRWELICLNSEQLHKIRLNRCYCYNMLNDPIINTEIHSFSDATMRIYAAYIYLQFKLRPGVYKIALVTEKTMILDGRKTTVPRAELNGVVLMSKICSEVVPCFQREHNVIRLLLLD